MAAVSETAAVLLLGSGGEQGMVGLEGGRGSEVVNTDVRHVLSELQPSSGTTSLSAMLQPATAFSGETQSPHTQPSPLSLSII